MKDYDYEQYVFVLKKDEYGLRAKELLSVAKNKKSQLIAMALTEFAERYQINDNDDVAFTIKNYDRVKNLVGNNAPVAPLPETKKVTVAPKKLEVVKNVVEEDISDDDDFEAIIDPSIFKNAQASLQKFAL